MPISIRIHESGKYVVSTYTGRISDDEFRPAYDAFFAGNEVPVNTPELVDFSAADLSGVTHAGLDAFARWANDFLRGRGETARKSALYHPGLPGRSKLILFEVMMQDAPEIFRTFTRRDEAVRWLIEPAPVSESAPESASASA